MDSLLRFLFICLASRAYGSSPVRRIGTFSMLPQPQLAVASIRSAPLESAQWGFVPQYVQQEHFLVTDDCRREEDLIEGSKVEFLCQTKRVSLYGQLWPKSSTHGFLGFVESDIIFRPTHEQPYLVYHLQDDLCGEHLSQTLYDPWLISFSIASHELEMNETQSYNLILSYNTHSLNFHWQQMLRTRGFKGLDELNQDMQETIRGIYEELQFFYPNIQHTWVTFFRVAMLSNNGEGSTW